ncbi:unnamed protein product, partial [marine sediment metagenome]
LREKLKDAENIKSVLLRINELVELSPDPRYENPYDTAVAVYTWVLYNKNIYIGRIAADYASRLRQGFWAPEYARYVMLGNLLWNGASLSMTSQPQPNVIKRTEAGDCFVMTDLLGMNIRNTVLFLTEDWRLIGPEPWIKSSRADFVKEPFQKYDYPQEQPGVRIMWSV